LCFSHISCNQLASNVVNAQEMIRIHCSKKALSRETASKRDDVQTVRASTSRAWETRSIAPSRNKPIRSWHAVVSNLGRTNSHLNKGVDVLEVEESRLACRQRNCEGRSLEQLERDRTVNTKKYDETQTNIRKRAVVVWPRDCRSEPADEH
jgi:hypothetical protein